MKSPHTGSKRVYYAFKYSWKGFMATWHSEEAFRQEVLLFIVLAPLAFWLSETKMDFILLIGSLLLVLIVEILNSSIETVVDRISDEYHVLSGKAKDQASAAVFLSLVIMVMTWGMYLFQKLF